MTNLIARAEQLRKMNSALKTAIQGRLQIVLVAGEAGIGKTATVTAFFQQAKAENRQLLCAIGRCQSIAGSQQEPFLPFLTILQEITKKKTDSDRWKALLRGIAEVGPDWIQLIPVVGDLISAVIRTAQWRKREFSGVRSISDTQHLMLQYSNILRKTSGSFPLLLLIEDLHWSDNATLDLISYLADSARDTAVMLTITYRPTDIVYEVNGKPHPVKQLIDKLKRYNQCIEIEIPAFTYENLAEYLLATRHSFPKLFVERILRHSGGNPLFVNEFITLVHAQHLLKRQNGVFYLNQPSVKINIPTTLLSVIEQRLGLIDEDSLRLLSYASIQGEKFFSKILSKLTSFSELSVLDKLHLLERVHKLIKQLEDMKLIVKMGSHYQFIHILVQQVLYYSYLSEGQRRELHLATADGIVEFLGEDAVKWAFDLAVHYESGGDFLRAIPYHLIAGEQALSVFALDDTLQRVRTVRQLAASLSNKTQSTHFQIEAIIQLTEVFFWKASYEDALKAIDEGESLCKLGEFTELNAFLLYWRSQVLRRRGQLTQAVEAARTGLAILKDPPSNTRLQGALYALMGWYSDVISHDEVLRALTKAIDIADIYHYDEIKVQALMYKARLDLHWTDRMEDSLQLTQEALKISEKNNYFDEQIYCLRALFSLYSRARRAQEALSASQKAVTVAYKIRAPQLLNLVLYTSSYCVREIEHNWPESLKLARESINIAEANGFLPALNTVWNWFDVTFGLGLWPESEKALDYILKITSRSQAQARGVYLIRRGLLDFVFGRYNLALGAFEEAFEVYQTFSPSEREARGAEPYLGLALIEVGQVPRAINHLKIACEYWRDRHPPAMGQCLRALARAQLIGGDIEQTVILLNEALTIVDSHYGDERINWPILPHVSMDLGRALLLSNNVEAAFPHAIFAVKQFKSWRHFLYGEAAYIVGQILILMDKRLEAVNWLNEAHADWQRLGLVHHLREWKSYMHMQRLI